MKNIIRRELKINLKTFITFLGVCLAFLLMINLMYPMLKENMVEFEKLLESFPDSFLAAFNMDDLGFGSIIEFYATEGYLYMNLLIGAYAVILGSSILLKEKSDKTSEYLLSKPISRKEIYLSKYLAGVIYVLAMNLIVYLVNVVSSGLIDTLDIVSLSLLSLATFLLTWLFYTIGFFISLFKKKPRKTLGIGLGILFGSYLVFILSLLSEKIQFLENFSIFYYLDSTPMVKENTFNIVYIIGIISLTLILLTIGLKIYEKKDIY